MGAKVADCPKIHKGCPSNRFLLSNIRGRGHLHSHGITQGRDQVRQWLELRGAGRIALRPLRIDGCVEMAESERVRAHTGSAQKNIGMFLKNHRYVSEKT